MNKLLDCNSNTITEYISEALKKPDVVKVRNRLLDGSYNVQSIGEAVDIIEVSCTMTEAGKGKLDLAYEEDSTVRLEWYGEYYIGTLKDAPFYEYFMKGSSERRLYNVVFSFVVSSEGSI